ncbi:MAG: hypothetical protein V4592_06085 [Bacteroidota bacterium]
MKIFKGLVLTIALLTGGIAAKAQFYQDIQGNAIKENKSADTEGSPYLLDNWTAGSATVEKGRYDNIKLKYDIKNDQLIFAGKDDVPMGFADPVKKFSINNRNFANGFPAIGAQGKDSYYEVLSDGKVKLLKHYAKHIEENKTYGSAAVTREYTGIETYYVFKDDKMSAIKPDRKNISDLTADKAAQIDTYLKTNKVNFKNDASLGQLFDYYNGL